MVREVLYHQIYLPTSNMSAETNANGAHRGILTELTFFFFFFFKKNQKNQKTPEKKNQKPLTVNMVADKLPCVFIMAQSQGRGPCIV